jgi:hypothetical protein
MGTNLELLESETTTRARAHAVFSRGALDDGTEETLNGTREDAGSLLLTGLTAAKVASGLVEPGANAQLPVLVEVGVGDNIVVTHHFPVMNKNNNAIGSVNRTRFTRLKRFPRRVVALK